MDYFRQLSTALGKGPGPLPGIVVGDEVALADGASLWRLHDGVRRVRVCADRRKTSSL